jgi:hypothetical protein
VPAEASEVVHGVVALGADVVGQELHVDLYGGTPALCASVRYSVPDGRRRRAMHRRVQRWVRAGAPLTLTLAGATVTLQEDVAPLGDPLRAP